MDKEKDTKISLYQNLVEDILMRNRSVLEIMGKFQQYNARMHRAIVHAATHCGCITIRTHKQTLADDLAPGQEASQVYGKLCPQCREVLMKEAGEELYYFTSLLNVFDISLEDILDEETDHMQTLGKFLLK